MRFARPTAAPPFEDALHPLDKNYAQKAKIKVKSVQVVDEVERQRCESGKILHVKQTSTHTHTHTHIGVVHVCVYVRSLSVTSLVLGDFAICLLFAFQEVFQITPPSSTQSQSLPVCAVVTKRR